MKNKYLILFLLAGFTFPFALSAQDKREDSLLSLLNKQAGADTFRINTLAAIAEHYTSIQKYKAIVPYAEEAFKLSQKKENGKKLPVAAYYSAFARYLGGDYDSSLVCALTGLEAVKKYPDAIMEIKLNAIACKNLLNQERYAPAAGYAFAALRKAEEIKDSTNIARGYQLVSTSFFYQDKFEDALAYTFRAYNYYKSRNMLSNMLESCNSIGETNLKLNRPGEAIRYFQDALSIIKKLGDEASPYALANNDSYMAEAYEKSGDNITGNTEQAAEFFNKAFLYYSNSIRQWQKIDSMGNFGVAASVIGDLKVQAGSLLFRMKRFEESKKYISEGIAVCLQTDSKKALSDAYLIMSRIDSVFGNTVSSFNNYKLHIRYRDSIFSTDNSRLLEIYRNQSENERKDKELQLQIADSKLKSALAQKRKQQLLFAWVMAALILSGAIFGFYRYRRLNKIKAEQKLLKERFAISQDLHDHVGSTLSSISVFSKVAQIHGEANKKEEMNELLGRIRTTSNTMMTEMNDIVWAINPGNDTMEKIIQRMEAYARPLMEARNIQFQFDYDNTLPVAKMEMEKRKNFYLIFKEAVNNAAKYSAASAVHTSLQMINRNLVLEIKDNGTGFNLEQTVNKKSLSGNGLLNMQARARAIDGALAIVSKPGNGTTISLVCSA